MKIYFVRNLGQRFKNAMIGNQPQNKLKHGLKKFKNPFNKEGFKRVVILTLIERMGVRKISLKSA
ncbi:hypothetical protein FNE35_03990 [Helicobacter pylori]|nr:hypothetical protein FNE35_03990 [Helicobacter pylori]